MGPTSHDVNNSRSLMGFNNRKYSHAASGGSFERDQEQSFTQNLVQGEFAPMTHTKGSFNNSRKSRDFVTNNQSPNNSNRMSSKRKSSGSGSGSRGLASNRSGMNTQRYQIVNSNPGSFNSNHQP